MDALWTEVEDLRRRLTEVSTVEGRDSAVAGALEAGFERVVGALTSGRGSSGTGPAGATSPAGRYDGALWAKMAPKADMIKLARTKKPTLMSFLAWRRGVERWAQMAGGPEMTMHCLTPRELAGAAWHFLDATL